KRYKPFHTRGCGDFAARLRRQVSGSCALFGVSLTEGRFTKKCVSSLGQCREARSVLKGIGKIGGVGQFLAVSNDQNLIGQVAGGLSCSVRQGDSGVAFSRRDARLEIAEPGPGWQSERSQAVSADV